MKKTNAKEYARQMTRAADFEAAQAVAHETHIETLMQWVDTLDKTDEKYAALCKRINDLTRAAVACWKRAEDYTARGIAARQAAE